VNRAGGRSGSLRNIGRIEQWNVGSGAIEPVRAPGPSARYRFGQRTFAGTRGNSETRRNRISLSAQS